MPLPKSLHEKFLNIASALSPENLSCDGELSRSAIERREKALRKQWEALEAEAGRTVTEGEVWAQLTVERR